MAEQDAPAQSVRALTKTLISRAFWPVFYCRKGSCIASRMLELQGVNGVRGRGSLE